MPQRNVTAPIIPKLRTTRQHPASGPGHFTPRNVPPIPIEQETVWAPGTVWVPGKENTLLALPGIEPRSHYTNNANPPHAGPWFRN